MTVVRRARAVAALGLAVLVPACAHEEPPEPAHSGPLKATVVREIPVEPVFTQGLFLLDRDTLVQSYGLYGESGVRLVDALTGATEASVPLDDDEFGEGIDRRADGALLQLTWREHVVHVREATSLAARETLTLDTEGWGICVDEEGVAWTSDGTATLSGRDAETMRTLKTIQVTDEGREVEDLNELECTPAGIWANVWHTDRIILVDPATGTVAASLDLSELSRTAPRSGSQRRSEQVLNGIAFDEESGNLLVTGKEWTTIYEVSVRPRSE